MVALSLARLGFRLAEFLLRVSDMVVAPSPGGVATVIGEVRAGWRDIAALRRRGDKAVDSFGEQIASRLEGKIADARRQCEDRGVDAGLLRGAVTEVEVLLGDLAEDNNVVVAAVRNPDDFGEVIRGRVQKYRRNVEAEAEPFFDALVRAVTGEFVLLAPGSKDFQIGALRQLLNGVDAILDGIEVIKERTAHFGDRFDRLEDVMSEPVPRRPSRIRFGSRPMKAAGFVGRREQAGLFEAVLSGAAGRTAFTGMRGSGKSQLATAVAARCEAQDWPLVAWIPAGSREAVLSGLAELGRELGVDVEDGPSLEVIAQRCLTALASAQESNRLIVFDDVENPDDLKSLIPRGAGLRVLVTTTRLADWAGASWVHVPIGVFEREQSISILLDRTGQVDREAADAVAGALGDLPVAVAQAAATARRGRYDLADYLETLKRTTLEAGVRRREGDEYSEAVGVALWLAFQSALERIEKRSPHREAIARVQLGALSVLAAPGVPARWLGGDGASADARGALSELIESSVCQLSEDDSKMMIHGLQGRVIREVWKDDPESWGQIEEAAAGLLGAVDVTAIPISDSGLRRREALDLVEQLRAVAGQDHSKSLFSHPRTADALAHALWHAAELGDPQAALSLSDAVNLLDETLGPDNPHTLAARNNLANAYRSAGRLEQAIELHKRTLADSERVLGPDHPRTLTSRSNLASAYQDAGKLDEAIDLFEQVLADRERVLDPDHPDILTSRNNLASAYQSASSLKQAIPLFERNLADSERLLGPDHPHTLASRNNLAKVCQDAGKLDEAIDLFEQVLADSERLLGVDHPRTLTSRGNLASAYRSAGRLEEAIDLFEQVLADSERLLGVDHPRTLASQGNLAGAYRYAGRLEEAIDLFEQNLVDRERLLGADHPDVLISRNNLATAYWSADRPDDAIPLLEQTLAEALRILGSDHPDTRFFRNNLAAAYRAVGRDEEAAALLDPPSDPDDTDTEAPS